MRHLPIAAFASLLILAPSVAAAEAVFEGALLFSAARNCQFVENDWRFISTYRLTDAAKGSTFLGLTTAYETGAVTYEIRGTRPPSLTFGNVFGTSADDGTTHTFVARIRITKSQPAKVAASSPFVAIAGQIESPFDDPGKNGSKCVADFKANYARRLDP